MGVEHALRCWHITHISTPGLAKWDSCVELLDMSKFSACTLLGCCMEMTLQEQPCHLVMAVKD